MMAQSRAESRRDTYNYGQYLNQYPPNTIKVIREFERIQKRICRHKMSIMFNEICIYIHIYECILYIYIYIHIYIYISAHWPTRWSVRQYPGRRGFNHWSNYIKNSKEKNTCIVTASWFWLGHHALKLSSRPSLQLRRAPRWGLCPITASSWTTPAEKQEKCKMGSWRLHSVLWSREDIGQYSNPSCLPSLPLLPGPLWSGMVVPDRVLSMG